MLDRAVSVPVPERSFRMERERNSLRFLTFFKHIEVCIYVCLSAYGVLATNLGATAEAPDLPTSARDLNHEPS